MGKDADANLIGENAKTNPLSWRGSSDRDREGKYRNEAKSSAEMLHLLKSSGQKPLRRAHSENAETKPPLVQAIKWRNLAILLGFYGQMLPHFRARGEAL